MKIFKTLTALNVIYSEEVQNPLSDMLVTNVHTMSEADGARIARTLVFRESLMNVNTFESSTSSGKSPVSFMEYYADCDGDGDPYWLIVEIGSSFQNILKGSSYSFTIRAGDHWALEDVNMTYPGGLPSSPAGSPRVNLKGHLDYVDLRDDNKLANLEQCFTARHPDSKWWLPSKEWSPHKSRWAKIYVNDLYLVGGFGDRTYIGNIDAETYHEAAILGL